MVDVPFGEMPEVGKIALAAGKRSWSAFYARRFSSVTAAVNPSYAISVIEDEFF
jgi:hypothetical protein